MKGMMSTAEWQVMRVLWAHPNSGSSQIIDYLQADFEWKPSTVKTLLTRLKDKGLIEAQAEGKRFVYRAVTSEQQELEKMGQDWLDNQCHTKHGEHLLALLKQAKLTQSDLENLVAWAEKAKKTAPTQVACSCLPGQCDCHRS